MRQSPSYASVKIQVPAGPALDEGPALVRPLEAAGEARAQRLRALIGDEAGHFVGHLVEVLPSAVVDH